MGREFERNDDGWALYNEWASRSAKYEDKGNVKAMRGCYYDDSNVSPQGGEPATIATLFRRAQDGGYTFPVGGLDNRPVVSYREGRAIETVDVVLRLLDMERESGSDVPRRVYAFGNGLGRVIRAHDTSAMYDRDGVPPNGWLLKVKAHDAMSIGSRITHTATVVQVSPTGNVRQVECPREVSTLLLTDYADRFPRLNGIVQWPIVIGGRLAGVDEEYNLETGLVFALPDGLDLSGIQGTHEEAMKAWRWWHDVAFDQFPFASEQDAAAALALALTFLQRRAMETAPAVMVSAPIQGSGKTSLVRMISRLVHGRSAGAGPLSMVDEEVRKAITAALLSNPPCVLFDNLKAGSVFASTELAIATTSGEWEDRKLGSSERVTLPNRAVFAFTGNNISLRSDLRRRFLTIRMVPEVKDHHAQPFRRSLDPWAIAHRAEALLRLASIALWGAKHAVPVLPTSSGFVEWDAQVRGPVFALTGVDPWVRSVEELDDEDDDVEGNAKADLALAWTMFAADPESSTAAAVEEAARKALESSDPTRKACARGFFDAIIELLGIKGDVHAVTAKQCGDVLKSLKDQPIEVEGVLVRFVAQKLCPVTRRRLWRLKGTKTLLAKRSAEGF